MADSVTSGGRIFISYRRDETAYPAAWLFDRLTQTLGRGQVFKDVNSIAPGDDFVQKITQAVASCDVLLALIGKEWLTARDEHGLRLPGRSRIQNPRWPRQHFIKFTRNLHKDTLSVDGAIVLKKSEFTQDEFLVTDQYGQVRVNFKLTKGRGMELAEAAVNGFTWGLVKRVGPVRITVDNVLVFEG
jgi:hypothetical protein